MELTKEQQKAIAMAKARQRAALVQKRDSLDASLENSTLAGAAGGALNDINDNMRLAANGISLGFLDKALGPEARAQTDAARERQGWTGMASEVAGSFAPAGALLRAGATATRLPGAIGKYAGLPLDGAAFGAAQAYGNDQDVATGAAIGGGLGALGGVLGKAVDSGYRGLAPRAAAKSSEALRDASSVGYTDAKRAGLVFAPDAFERSIDDAAAITNEMGVGGTLSDITDELFPKSSRLISKLQDKRGATPTLEDVEKLKRALSKAGKGLDADAAVNKQLAGTFKDMIDTAAPSDFIAGDVNLGISGIQKGRDLWGKAAKTERLEKALTNAKDRVGANYTQAGLLTALRQEVKAIKKAPDFKRSWTPNEQKIIEQLVRGRSVENAARLAGLFAPRGPVTGAVLGATAYANPLVGAALTGAGMGGRALATKLGTNRFADLLNEVQGVSSPKLSPAAQERIRAMVRALMAGGTTVAATQD